MLHRLEFQCLEVNNLFKIFKAIKFCQRPYSLKIKLPRYLLVTFPSSSDMQFLNRDLKGIMEIQIYYRHRNIILSNTYLLDLCYKRMQT